MSDIKPAIKKKLLVFAHRGEAQAFIDEYRFEQLSFHFNGLFKNDSDFLLITGEGPQNSGEKTVAVLAVHSEIDQVINIGIAGSLSPRLKIGDSRWIRSSYAQNAEKCEFKSFTSLEHDSIDCITAFGRITTTEQKKNLSSFADLVDRELWAIASAAHLFKKECLALKLVSDNFEGEVQCDLIKADAPKLSQAMLKTFQQKKLSLKSSNKFSHKIKLDQWIVDQSHFYFTTTQERILLQLINGLNVKDLINGQEDLEIIMSRLVGENPEKPAKEMTRLLITELSERLNPLKQKIKTRLEQALQPLTDAGVQSSYDSELESAAIVITHRIKSFKDQKRLAMALEIFNYQKIKDVFDGKFE